MKQRYPSTSHHVNIIQLAKEVMERDNVVEINSYFKDLTVLVRLDSALNTSSSSLNECLEIMTCGLRVCGCNHSLKNLSLKDISCTRISQLLCHSPPADRIANSVQDYFAIVLEVSHLISVSLLQRTVAAMIVCEYAMTYLKLVSCKCFNVVLSSWYEQSKRSSSLDSFVRQVTLLTLQTIRTAAAAAVVTKSTVSSLQVIHCLLCLCCTHNDGFLLVLWNELYEYLDMLPHSSLLNKTVCTISLVCGSSFVFLKPYTC